MCHNATLRMYYSKFMRNYRLLFAQQAFQFGKYFVHRMIRLSKSKYECKCNGWSGRMFRIFCFDMARNKKIKSGIHHWCLYCTSYYGIARWWACDWYFACMAWYDMHICRLLLSIHTHISAYEYGCLQVHTNSAHSMCMKSFRPSSLSKPAKTAIIFVYTHCHTYKRVFICALTNWNLCVKIPRNAHSWNLTFLACCDFRWNQFVTFSNESL